MKQLNIFELQNSISQKKKHRVNVYESVLGKCHSKIQIAANKEKYECYYDVPQYVVGLPLFNINECVDFIITQLQTNGFRVNYYFPKLLHISWHPDQEKESSSRPKSIKHIEHSSNRNSLDNTPPMPQYYNQDPSAMMLHYIPYKNDKGKFVLNID